MKSVLTKKDLEKIRKKAEKYNKDAEEFGSNYEIYLMDYDPPSFCILYPGLTKDYKKVYSFYRYVIDVEGDRKKRGHTTPEEYLEGFDSYRKFKKYLKKHPEITPANDGDVAKLMLTSRLRKILRHRFEVSDLEDLQ